MASSASHLSISKDAMIASFPPKISVIEGEITIKELLRAFRHLIVCAQSTVITYDAFNFLYLVVLARLWDFTAKRNTQCHR